MPIRTGVPLSATAANELAIDSLELDEFGNAETLSGVLKATYYHDIFDIQYYEEEFAAFQPTKR